MSDLSEFVEHQKRIITMDAQTKEYELAIIQEENTTFCKEEGDEEYWDTIKDMKVIKAKWDLEFHKLNMFYYIKKWEAKYSHLLEKYDMKVNDIVIEEVKTD